MSICRKKRDSGPKGQQDQNVQGKNSANAPHVKGLEKIRRRTCVEEDATDQETRQNKEKINATPSQPSKCRHVARYIAGFNVMPEDDH